MKKNSSQENDLFNLKGRVALVTGGSRGMGKEMALAFARAGADVVVASRKEKACKELASQLTELTGQRALGVGFHAGRWQQCQELVDTAYKHFDRVDVLVNNAGMSPLYPSLAEVSEELFDKVIGVNLKGPFRLSALVGERMAAGDGGSIINVSSIAAVQPTPNELPYATAKAGLNALTLGLARAYAPSVRVNCIMPGPFLTDISKAWDMDAFEQSATAHIPLQRGGRPDEVVGTALYLASDASSYTTGSVIKVDGGTAWPAA